MRTDAFWSPPLLALVVVALLAVACGGENRSPTAPSSVPSPAGIAAGSGVATVATGSPDGAQDGADVPEVTAASAKNKDKDKDKDKDKNKVDICHVTGNGTFHLLNISANAKAAHLGHGDVEPDNGACPTLVTATAFR